MPWGRCILTDVNMTSPLMKKRRGSTQEGGKAWNGYQLVFSAGRQMKGAENEADR
jgi:hypothetical protein